jgi:DNA-binding transcriptional regulator YhcF (GntR family)
MPKLKCTEEDVREVVKNAIKEGKPLRSRKELVESLVKRCNYDNVTSAYSRVKKLEERGLLRYVKGYGYVLAEKAHDRLILRTCALLLDLAGHVKSFSEILREGVSKYYDEEMPGITILQLMEKTLEHVITGSENLSKEVKEMAPLIEGYEKKESQPEDTKKIVDYLYNRMMDTAATFYLNAKLSGYIAGWCELCRGMSIDKEIRIAITGVMSKLLLGSFK